MSELDEKAVRAAFMVNHHPDAEPSSVEMAKMERSIRAYLAAADPAAATIERLTRDNERLTQINADHCRTVNSYIVDNARQEDGRKAAEAALAKAQQEREQAVGKWVQQGEAFRAEIASLSAQLAKAREALADLVREYCNMVPFADDDDDPDCPRVVIRARAALAPAKTEGEMLALTATLLPPPDKCPPAYHGCMCECHRVPGIVHVAACCAPGPNDDWPDQQYWYERAALAPAKTEGE